MFGELTVTGQLDGNMFIEQLTFCGAEGVRAAKCIPGDGGFLRISSGIAPDSVANSVAIFYGVCTEGAAPTHTLRLTGQLIIRLSCSLPSTGHVPL